MQEHFQLTRQDLRGLPLVNQFIERTRLSKFLSQLLGDSRAGALLLLLKNILLERQALYAIGEWSKSFDPSLVNGACFGDDAIARALDRLFQADRASLLTRWVLEVVRQFGIQTDEIHQDTTSVKLCGAYGHQRSSAVQLKRGYSKDHRPDLKQLVYELSVTRDGAVPLIFKTHDGNRTDDTLHWDNWQTLRGLLGRSDFLYVADSKLCVSETMMKIDRNQGRFITMMPDTRKEGEEFVDRLLGGQVRWEPLWSKRSSRKPGKTDHFEAAAEPCFLREGFRLYWFRSSEKKRRDFDDREDRITSAWDHLRSLEEPGRRRPRTEKALKRRAEGILNRFGAQKWIRLEITLERIEKFKQQKKGRAGKDTSYRRIVKSVPRLSLKRDLEAIAASEVMDGVFPLTTNASLKPLEVLKAYKYQPHLEKRHALLKSGLNVAPVFLKRNDRIEALMTVYFMALLIAALIERQIRKAMDQNKIPELPLLPEERPSKHPTFEQISRVFDDRTRHLLYSKEGNLLQTFTDPLAKRQLQILSLLDIKPSVYL